MLETERTVLKESINSVDKFIGNVCPPDGVCDAWDTLKAHLLEHYDTSDYAVQPTASPKLPSDYDICKELGLIHTHDMSFVGNVIYAIKKLGNFA